MLTSAHDFAELQRSRRTRGDTYVALRFKRAGDRYLVELFPGVEFDVREPTAVAFQPVLDALYEEIATHYDRGLDLFLENRAAKLRLPFSPPEPKPLPDTGNPESER